MAGVGNQEPSSFGGLFGHGKGLLQPPGGALTVAVGAALAQLIVQHKTERSDVGEDGSVPGKLLVGVTDTFFFRVGIVHGSHIHMDYAVVGRMKVFGQNVLMAAQLADGKIAEYVSGLLGKSLNTLTKDFGGGQPVQAQRLGKERLASILRYGIEMRLADTDQSDHRPDDISVGNAIFALHGRAKSPQMVLKFGFGKLGADEGQTSRRCDGCGG